MGPDLNSSVQCQMRYLISKAYPEETWYVKATSPTGGWREREKATGVFVRTWFALVTYEVYEYIADGETH